MPLETKEVAFLEEIKKDVGKKEGKERGTEILPTGQGKKDLAVYPAFA